MTLPWGGPKGHHTVRVSVSGTPRGHFFPAHAKLRVKLNLGVSEVLAEKKCPRINLGIS